ncbi:hypothetical protein MLD38_033494 [Melastoma candidum]|uniref:Uncharacterized protein n=1 Tax=Melastoma candidum TaxID=119954 RepID=A0ACB9M6R5_9MYRT|nr:hypothetical protein MLD38_033494 [Melastoma candidum]
MGDDDLNSHHPTPKLSIFTLPRPKPPEPPGLLTPPLHLGAAVPFQWEEAPGKPLPCLSRSPHNPPAITGGAKRCLDLPPGLLHNNQGAIMAVTNHVTVPSPTTVLEGPDPCPRKRLTSTWSFRRAGSRERMPFGSTRWAGLSFGYRVLSDERKDVRGGHNCGSGISLSEFFCCDCEQDAGGIDDTKVKITRVRRRRSFLSLSPRNSHIWASIYDGLKQVVPHSTRRAKAD